MKTKDIQVGTQVVATRKTGVCDVGEKGVCYEVYELAGRPGYSFIFQSGRYDGFSPSEVEIMLWLAGHCPAVASYRFRNVIRLSHDFESGYFDPAFDTIRRHP